MKKMDKETHKILEKYLDKYFPKGKCKERGEAVMMAVELGFELREAKIKVLEEIFKTCYQEDSKTLELVETKLEELRK